MNINWLPILGSIIGFKRTQKEIPKLAKELGLQYKPANDKREIGLIVGSYKGQKIKIDVDKQTITLNFKNSSQFNNVRLKTERDWERETTLHFKSGNRTFDRCFKTKRAPKNLQNKIIGNARFFNTFSVLYKMRWRLIEVHNDRFLVQYKGSGFSVNYTLGNNSLLAQSTAGFCYIPADYIRKIVPVMAECANSLN